MDHLQHLRQVLRILSDNQLYVKLSKCQFGVLTVGYLGHLISAEGVAVDPAKIQAVQNWPIPATPKDVRGFLGLAGYYRKFMRIWRHSCTIKSAPIQGGVSLV
jgi:predicted RNA polymerase sigma factor